ncbi:hypothetical protein D187_003011 [Cystobacter fuscus DSM 2262]|uniref:SnoaL-like domain-containing protein n=1 Tax=Cystobacter fuscus (strain ATCC 25194 / DSM 2262 / NBRC 100088 / M29) TaxID=1242864 RepID=S9P8Q8_CYSF2|nr:nuclear transport factor 2 family protein [Cystobacter fuscus]EPX59521.1 hypothetical protein D187_003011 [Cystobacter fuscus DSM 2262]
MRAIQFIIVLVVVIALQGSSKAEEPCCKGVVTPMNVGTLGVEEQAILRAIEDYAKGFIQKDMGLLLSLWEARSQVSYVAVELDQPLLGMAELQGYYQGFLNSPFSVYSGNVTDLRVFLNGDMAYAFCHYNWVYMTGPGGSVLEQPTRATFVLAKRDGRWRYLHFHESILVPAGSTVSK